MDIEAMKQFPIEDFPTWLGHRPVQRCADAVWYRSPCREEHTPSFKVNPEKNLWFDFSEGKGDNIFTLAGEFIRGSDSLTQVKYVAEVAGMPVQGYEPRNVVDTHRLDGHNFEDVEVLPLQNRALLHYLQERDIPSAVAIANRREIHCVAHDKRCFAVVFGNEGDGYEICNPFFKDCVSPKNITLLSVGSDVCNVYEGFMDYLSARAPGIGGKEDYLVLNLVPNVARAYRFLGRYGKVQCHLDNNEAGRWTLEAMRTCYGEKVSDCSGTCNGCRGLNKHL